MKTEIEKLKEQNAALVAALSALVESADILRKTGSSEAEFNFGCAHEDARAALAAIKKAEEAQRKAEGQP